MDILATGHLGLTLSDQFRHLAAQCDAQAVWPATGAENRDFILNLLGSLRQIDAKDSQNFRLILVRAMQEMPDEQLPGLLADCAGALRFGAHHQHAPRALKAG